MKVIVADVAVIGGGPAGCSAAITLRNNGFSVVVVNDPNGRERPTETSSPALKQILDSLESSSAMAACEPCYGIVSNWGRRAPILKPGITSAYGDAWFIHRPRFDSYLRQTVCDRGALWIETKARNFFASECQAEVTTDDRKIIARWIVVATGAPSWTASIIGQATMKIDVLIGFWAKMPIECKERLLRIETAEFGWWYSCPGENGETLACCVTDATEARSMKLADARRWNALFQKTQIHQQYSGTSAAASINVISASTTSLAIKRGNFWVAVGDAAMKMDPLGSAGVIVALKSGQRAAQSVCMALEGKPDGLDKYEAWSHELMHSFAKQRQLQYAIEARNSSNGFWSRRGRIDAVPPTVLEIRNPRLDRGL